MVNRNALVLVAGAAIFALNASIASAQDTTTKTRPRATSTRRIPVAKNEVGGEVTTARVDTVTVYRTDTLSLPGRVDTVSMTNTITRVDTVVRPIPFTIPQVGGFYIGVAGGAAMPAAMFNDSDHPGWRVEVPFGFDPLGSLFGVRFNLGYGRFEPHSWVAPLLNNAQLMNADGDLKLRFVSATPHATRISIYALGGGSYNRYRDVLETNHGVYSIGDAIGGNLVLPSNPDHSWHSGWGWNSGGGVEVGHGLTNVFLEGRFARFHGEQTPISYAPVVLGVTIY